MKTMSLSLLTPSGVVIKDLACTSLLIPTVQGQVNLLEGHIQYLTQLSTGLIEAETEQNKKRHFTVSHGTCKVVGSEIVILSITAEKVEDIDLERAKAAKLKAEQKLAQWESLQEEEVIKYQRKLERAENRLKLGYLR